VNQSSTPPHSRAQHLDYRSLATVAAALVRCTHPADSPVSAQVAEVAATTGAVRITWCALCGALGSDHGLGEQWQPPALLLLLERPSFEELSQILHVLHRCRELREQDAAGHPASTETLRVHAALAALATTQLARDLDPLDNALADMRTLPTDLPPLP
jgi:hypothetical protein